MARRLVERNLVARDSVELWPCENALPYERPAARAERRAPPAQPGALRGFTSKSSHELQCWLS